MRYSKLARIWHRRPDSTSTLKHVERLCQMALYGGTLMENEVRTELVAFRLTPVEKLRLMQAARKPKYQGSISNLLRDLLSGTVGTNDKSAQVCETGGAPVVSK